jgi:hypothetical protein
VSERRGVGTGTGPESTIWQDDGSRLPCGHGAGYRIGNDCALCELNRLAGERDLYKRQRDELLEGIEAHREVLPHGWDAEAAWRVAETERIDPAQMLRLPTCPTCGIARYWLEQAHSNALAIIDRCPDSFHGDREGRLQRALKAEAHS